MTGTGADTSDDGLDFSVDDGVALLRLDRPEEGNAITPAMQRALERAWQRVIDDPAIRVAIITGTGEKHFCTGASVGALRDGGGDALLSNLPNEAANRFSPRHCNVWKPVICAVNGLVNGGGLHFVVDSDIVIAHRGAAFMDSHVNVGSVGALENIGVARRATPGAALLMTLVGRTYRMPAERAYQLGLVDLLEIDAPAVLARARELAEAIKRNSPQAMANSKRAIWAAQEMGYRQALDFGWELLKAQWSHPDFEEGPRAFLERRQAVWNPDPNARRGGP